MRHLAQGFPQIYWRTSYKPKPQPDHWTPRGLTGDADLGRPLGGAVQHALLDLLHLGAVGGLVQSENLLDLLEDLGLVPLADLHAVLQDHDDVLRAVLRTVLGALLRRPWGREGGTSPRLHQHTVRQHIRCRRAVVLKVVLRVYPI